ncbi:DUF692 domain-containing protein [Hydrogenophaga sp. 5NK40-0174]|uniref:MNIO family bufferin maturase n=1 Tax=Hydrogenophaga sp. 5NK40-0174 TaxID=3127649 RepID=UPI003101E819
MSTSPITGFGLGLRTDHYADFRQQSASQRGVDWLEVISENYMVAGGKPLAHLDAIRRDTPMVMHGVSLSIGGTDAINRDYLKALKQLVERIEPAWVSDHLCWTGVNGHNLHDLLPLPYTDVALRHLTDRIQLVQDTLGRPLVLENVSSYIRWQADEMSEWDFIATLMKRTGCEWLLDVNNVYVSAKNHGFDPHEFINAMPADRVRQIHLAGHETDANGFLIDTHDHPVCEDVWELYRYTIERLGPVPTMIERDDNIPDLSELIEELNRARKESSVACENRRAAAKAVQSEAIA